MENHSEYNQMQGKKHNANKKNGKRVNSCFCFLFVPWLKFCYIYNPNHQLFIFFPDNIFQITKKKCENDRHSINLSNQPFNPQYHDKGKHSNQTREICRPSDDNLAERYRELRYNTKEVLMCYWKVLGCMMPDSNPVIKLLSV